MLLLRTPATTPCTSVRPSPGQACSNGCRLASLQACWSCASPRRRWRPAHPRAASSRSLEAALRLPKVRPASSEPLQVHRLGAAQQQLRVNPLFLPGASNDNEKLAAGLQHTAGPPTRPSGGSFPQPLHGLRHGLAGVVEAGWVLTARRGCGRMEAHFVAPSLAGQPPMHACMHT